MTAKPEREVDARLADWVDGRLSERDRERFVAELRVSPQLRKDLEDYERTVATLRAALQAPIRPVQIADRVLAAIAAGDQGGGAGPRWRHRSFVWSLASAAALLVLALWVNAWSPSPKTDPTKALDVAKIEPDKEKRISDEVRKEVAKDERAVRDQVEEDLSAERERADPKKPTAPTTQPPPPAAAATEPATPAPRATLPAEGNESSLGAVTQDKPQVPVPKVAPAQDPAISPSRDADNKRVAGGGGEQAGADAPEERERGTYLEAGEQLPVIVVQGRAIALISRLQDGTPAPSGPGTAGQSSAGAPAPASRPPAAPAVGAEAPAPDGAMRKAAEATALPLQLDAFFKRQMTVAGGADSGTGGWSIGGLQFTPLPAAAPLAVDGDRKETEEKAQAESAKDRRRGGVAGKDDAARPVERAWLVEGSKEELELVIRQLSLFAQSGSMQLTTGETSEGTLPPRGAPVGAAVPVDRDAAGARALPRSRLVLRFTAQPR